MKVVIMMKVNWKNHDCLIQRVIIIRIVSKGTMVPEEIECRVADNGRCGLELRMANGVD